MWWVFFCCLFNKLCHLRQPVILPAVGPASAKVRASTSLLSLAKTASLKSRPHRKPGKDHPDQRCFHGRRHHRLAPVKLQMLINRHNRE